MGDLVKLRGDHSHPEVLSGGQTIAPGESFARTLLGDEDQRLVDEGLIIDCATAKLAAKGE